jgi:hypothetical protein
MKSIKIKEVLTKDIENVDNIRIDEYIDDNNVVLDDELSIENTKNLTKDDK